MTLCRFMESARLMPSNRALRGSTQEGLPISLRMIMASLSINLVGNFIRNHLAFLLFNKTQIKFPLRNGICQSIRKRWFTMNGLQSFSTKMKWTKHWKLKSKNKTLSSSKSIWLSLTSKGRELQESKERKNNWILSMPLTCLSTRDKKTNRKQWLKILKDSNLKIKSNRRQQSH